MAKVRLQWRSFWFWVLSGVAALLAWIKHQLVPASMISELVREGLHYIVYLMTLQKMRVAEAGGAVKSIHHKSRDRSRKKKR